MIIVFQMLGAYSTDVSGHVRGEDGGEIGVFLVVHR